MDAIEAMLGRRSIRSDFESPLIDDELIDTVLRCGAAAPSSKGAKPWRFHVIRDRAALASIADAMVGADGIEQFVPLDPLTHRKRETWESTVVESADTLRSAAVGIFVENLGEFSRSRRAVADVPRELLEDALLGYSLELLGIGAAIENLWIAATAVGLSAVFMGDVLVAEATVTELLGFSGDLVGVFALRAGAPPAGNVSHVS